MNIKLIHTDRGIDKVIAAGTSSEVLAKFDDILTGVKSVKELARYSLIDEDDEPVLGIPGLYYGIIYAEAAAVGSLHPAGEDGRPDTEEPEIWDTLHHGNSFRLMRSNRSPWHVEQVGFDLFDDVAAACRREFEEWAAAHRLTRIKGDVWTHDPSGRRYYYYESVRDCYNCHSELIKLI